MADAFTLRQLERIYARMADLQERAAKLQSKAAFDYVHPETPTAASFNAELAEHDKSLRLYSSSLSSAEQSADFKRRADEAGEPAQAARTG